MEDYEVGVDRYFLKLGRNPEKRSHCLRVLYRLQFFLSSFGRLQVLKTKLAFLAAVSTGL